MTQELLDLIHARKGHFRFESGHHGDLWLDLDTLFLRPHTLEPHLRKLGEFLVGYGVEAICGPLTGGGLIAYAIANQLNLTFAYTERFMPDAPNGLYAVAYRLPSALETSLPGKRVAIVDDVINAGSAVRGTYEVLLAAEAIPVVVGALLILGSAATDYFAMLGIPLVSLTRQESHLWSPEACPLCVQNIPIEDLTPSS